MHNSLFTIMSLKKPIVSKKHVSVLHFVKSNWFFIGSWKTHLSIIWVFCILFNEAYCARSTITVTYRMLDLILSLITSPPFLYIDDIYGNLLHEGKIHILFILVIPMPSIIPGIAINSQVFTECHWNCNLEIFQISNMFSYWQIKDTYVMKPAFFNNNT